MISGGANVLDSITPPVSSQYEEVFKVVSYTFERQVFIMLPTFTSSEIVAISGAVAIPSSHLDACCCSSS